MEHNPRPPTHAQSVANTGDPPIQVRSHNHIFEVNDAHAIDRPAPRGMRQNNAARPA
ncbi:urease subunit beta, partial [Pseudomonas aeruginosa]